MLKAEVKVGGPRLEQLVWAEMRALNDVRAIFENAENVLGVQCTGEVEVAIVVPINSSQMKELTQVARRSPRGSGVASSGGV